MLVLGTSKGLLGSSEVYQDYAQKVRKVLVQLRSVHIILLLKFLRLCSKCLGSLFAYSSAPCSATPDAKDKSDDRSGSEKNIYLTPNSSAIQPSLSRSKWNMDEICGLMFYLLSYVDTPQFIFLKSFYAQIWLFLLQKSSLL